MASVDVFSNRAFFDCTETAANTLTFSQVNTGVQAFSKIAWVINKIEWYWGDRGSLVAQADHLLACISGSNKFTTISLGDPSVYAFVEWSMMSWGTAATGETIVLPTVSDYSSLPGGGLLIPGYPLFLAVEGVSLASAQHVTARVHFTMQELKADEYIELVEALRMIE